MFKIKNTEDIQIKISICKDVLEAIFDECDKNDINETGGRIIGYFDQRDNKVNIKACSLISSGPNARRSPTSFFQDGEYQETVFRKIETTYPEIEHLGNWHTHHVNGLGSLSSGDIETYRRVVNHEKYNIDFFYAFLIIAKNNIFYKRRRYIVKHFLLKKGDSSVYEIPSSQVKIIKEPAIFIDKGQAKEEIHKKEIISPPLIPIQSTVAYIRVKDKEIISEIYPKIGTFLSKQTNTIYWKGNLELIDNTVIKILVAESITENKPSYYIALANPNEQFFKYNQLYRKRHFDSAWKAIFSFERDLNRAIFKEIEKNKPSL